MRDIRNILEYLEEQKTTNLPDLGEIKYKDSTGRFLPMLSPDKTVL